MSGQWEVVGTKKDKINKPIKEKKIILNTPNVADVLPPSQLKKLYNSNKSNKENQKPQEKVKNQDGITVKKEKKPEKQEVVKLKTTKSIESALKSINCEEFQKYNETIKLVFPDAPLVWLKESVHYLNLKGIVEIQDPVFSNKKEGYPYSVVPQQLKKIIEDSVSGAGDVNVQSFFDICLTAMATDMSKNLPVLGYKLYLQYIAINKPNIVLANLNKHVTLRNSYQNSSNIGLSILWALGQSGLTDFDIGLKVFQEVMFPLIEMKNYSSFVIKYLINLINNHQIESLSKENYLFIMDIIFSNKKHVPDKLNHELMNSTSRIRSLALKGCGNKCQTFIEPLLQKLQRNAILRKDYKKILCDVTVDCLTTDNLTFNVWEKCYLKYLRGNTILLNYINKNWQILCKKFNKKLFKDILDKFSSANESLLSKKHKDDCLNDLELIIRELQQKMAAKENSAGFPFKKLFILVALALFGLVFYDVKQSGSWEKSQSLKTAKELHIYEYSLKAVNTTKQGLLWANERLEENFPEYHKSVVDFIEPYGDLFHDLKLIIIDVVSDLKLAFSEKVPFVKEWYDNELPKYVEKLKTTLEKVWTTGVTYYNNFLNYMTNEVFIGELSPENIQKVFLDAFNATQKKASEYYQWIYEKVQTTIK